VNTSTGETPAGDARPTDLRAAADDFTWLLNRFATETAGVVDAIAVSSDGLLIAVSELREHADSERLAAIVSGITSLAAGASGNYGLWDLEAALRWVRENVEAFGGDPGRVTVFGQSGGGEKVRHLTASPKTRGLFSQAIMQSGGGLQDFTPELTRLFMYGRVVDGSKLERELQYEVLYSTPQTVAAFAEAIEPGVLSPLGGSHG
jgi:hypothetical protein